MSRRTSVAPRSNTSSRSRERMVPLAQIILQFADAVARLDEALVRPKDAFMRDACIQRFEFTFDLSWKVLKVFLEDRLKVRCTSPRACLREAQVQGLIAYEREWLSMADDRNRTAHLYREELADAVYARLPEHLQRFRALLGNLQREIGTSDLSTTAE